MRRSYRRRKIHRRTVRYRRRKHIDWVIVALAALAVALTVTVALLILKYFNGELSPEWFY